MPGYYQRPMGGQLPMTPPDSGSGYGYSDMHYCHDPYSQAQNQCRQDGAYDYPPQSYTQPAVAPPTYQYQPNNYQPTTSLPPISNFFQPIGAPILPPLRINERSSFTDDFQRQLQQQEQQGQQAREQQRQVAKEEKATGGVSAHLDYEMDTMTDFVCSAVSSIFHLRQPTSPQFRKWVHQVLSATRLPAATILLSLYYLNDRMIRFPTTIKGGDNEVYRLLAVALILGSKFLDDNTFINRSWSDVTAIKVTELNRLEAYWLQLLEWRLHIDPSDESLDNNSFRSWSLSWEKHQYDKAAEKAAKQVPARLSPLDTNLQRHSQTNASRDRYSPYHSPYTASSSRSFEQPQPLSSLSARSSQFSTPYSSVDPWAPSSRKVDDYYKQPARYDAYAAAEAEELNRRAAAAAAEEQARQSSYQYRSDVHQSYYQTPVYNNSGWDTGSWSHHQHGCSCQSCQYSRHYSNYGMSSSYATQPVMG